jgi:hypothetical protein
MKCNTGKCKYVCMYLDKYFTVYFSVHSTFDLKLLKIASFGNSIFQKNESSQPVPRSQVDTVHHPFRKALWRGQC